MPKHIEDIIDMNPVLRDSAFRDSLRIWAAVEDLVEKLFADRSKEERGAIVADLLKNMGMIKEDPDGQK